MPKERLAVIGGGIAGMSAAYFLHRDYDVTLFEKNEYLGGHAHAIDIDYNGKHFMVDTAVMIFDKRNYPNFVKLLAEIRISESEMQPSDVSWGATFENNHLEYSNRKALLQWNNVFSLRSWNMFFSYVRFSLLSKRAFEKNPESLKDIPFREYLAHLRVSRDCIDYIIAPLYACIFSIRTEELLEFPAEIMLGFLYRQKMLGLSVGGSAWHMIRGSTAQYVHRLTNSFRDNVRLNTHIASIARRDGNVVVQFSDGSEESFHKVVIATHADQALKMLAEPTADESALLGAFRYTTSRKLIVHKDASVMPRRRSCWAAFTSNDGLRAIDGNLAMTYWLNLIQNIDHRYPLFISINTDAVGKEHRFAEMEYSHPSFTPGCHRAQQQLHRLQGVGGIYFSGSYFGYACHEDAVVSSMAVADLLGVKKTL